MIELSERDRLARESQGRAGPERSERSVRLAEMNKEVHAMVPRSRERSLFAMTMYDYILSGEAKPLRSNPKFKGYERTSK